MLRKHADNAAAAGLAMGLGAHLLWGFFPLYFIMVRHVSPPIILGWRVVHSAVAMAVLASALGLWPRVRAAAGDRRTLLTLLLTAALVAGNWLTFIWAVLNGRAVEAALGYFITPLFIVALGVAFLGERPGAVRTTCIVMAAVGVFVKAWLTGALPWVSLLLPATFGVYSLLRKTSAASSQVAMAVETFALAPIGLAFLGFVYATDPAAPADGPTLGLLALSGVLTVVPLLLFGGAAKRLTMTTLGFIQYLGPTCQLALAATVLREPVRPGDWWAFGLIWAALALFTADAARRGRRRRRDLIKPLPAAA